MKMKCVICQCGIVEDINKQKHRLDELLEYSVKDTPDILVFPELFLSGYFFDLKSIEDKFHNQEGIFVLGEIARRYKCFALGGIITKKEEKYFNSAVLINQNAEIQL